MAREHAVQPACPVRDRRFRRADADGARGTRNVDGAAGHRGGQVCGPFRPVDSLCTAH
ncbi:MAG: hypothetical protein RMK74_04975 [Myxococcales bacterium]|nr:hypothetical protein [Myxococcales bacterium]